MRIKILFAMLLMAFSVQAQKLGPWGWMVQTNAVFNNTSNSFLGHVNLNGNSLSNGNLQSIFLGSNTNLSVSNLISPIIVTNQEIFAPTVVYSNSITASLIPAFQPFGGEYVGIHVTNSAAISAATEQAAVGFPQNQTFDTFKRRITFRDSVFWSDGNAGDAASFRSLNTGATGTSTNDLFFYNTTFHAANFAFNEIGCGNYNFEGCDFEAIGSTINSACYLPDQGPNTNVLKSCKLTAKNSPLACGVLSQLNSYTWMIGCYFDMTTTNAAHESTAIAFSGEGFYTLHIKDSHFHLGGPGTNCIADWTFAGAGGANPCTLTLENCTYDGANSASGGWLINNSVTPAPTINVIGGNLSWTNFTTLTNVFFLNPPVTVIRTNFVSGQLYTNNYGTPIEASCTITNVQAAIAGTTRFDVWVFKQGGAADISGETNSVGGQTAVTSLATTNNAGVLSIKVPPFYVYTFTNQSGGVGNAAGPRGGQILIP